MDKDLLIKSLLELREEVLQRRLFTSFCGSCTSDDILIYFNKAESTDQQLTEIHQGFGGYFFACGSGLRSC